MGTAGRKKSGRRKKGNRRHQNKPHKQHNVNGSIPPLNDLLAAVRERPEDIDARLTLSTYYLLGAMHERIPGVLERIAEEPFGATPIQRAAIWTALGYGYIAQQRLADAERWSRRALEADPNSVDALYLLAFLALSSGDQPAAIRHGEAYLALCETCPEQLDLSGPFAVTPAHRAQLLNIIGSACMESGRNDEACRWYEKSIEADPGNCLPYLNLAKVHQRTGRPEEARDVAKRGQSACRRIEELRMLETELLDRPTVSACMIVKNEEELLPGCLESIRDWVDEIILVDTGSDDRTLEIAERYGARVYHQTWEGDFSKHRNYSMSQATSDWIFIIDADEELVPEDIDKLKTVIRDDRFDIVVMDVMNVYPDNPENLTFLPSMRLFRRSLGLHYDGIVHNQLVVPQDRPKARLGARIKHYGYGLSKDKMDAKVKRSRKLLERQLAEDPDNAFAHFNYAQLLRGQQGSLSDDDAAAILRSAAKVLQIVNPEEKTHRHLYLMALDQAAWTTYKQRRFDEALDYCRRALELRQDYLDPLHLLGHLYTAMERFEDAENAFKKYLEVQASYNPSTEHDPLILLHLDSRAASYYGLALLAGRKRDAKAERTWLLKTVELVPGYLNAAVRLGQLFIEEQDLEAAEKYFALQLSHRPHDLEGLLGLGYVNLQLRRYEQAEKLYRQALDVDPGNVVARRKLARVFAASGRSSDAAALLGPSMLAEDAEPEALADLARLHYDSGNFRESAGILRRLVSKENTTADLANDLANCYFKLGDFEEAERGYRLALTIDPTEQSAGRNLGIVLARLGKSAEAIDVLKHTYDRAPNMTELARIIGNLYAARGDWPEALPYLERRLKSEPEDYLALYDLSECYLAMGHTDSAKLGFGRVLQLDPEFAPARQRLDQLAEPSRPERVKSHRAAPTTRKMEV